MKIPRTFACFTREITPGTATNAPYDAKTMTRIGLDERTFRLVMRQAAAAVTGEGKGGPFGPPLMMPVYG